MTTDALILPIEPRRDSSNNIYYVCRIKAPCSINLSEGVCFIIWTNEPGQESMQISHLWERKDNDDERK